MGKKGVQLTQEKGFLEMQLNDLKKDADMSTFLESYSDKHDADVQAVTDAKRNIEVLLKHLADKTRRQHSMPSSQDVNRDQDDLRFKQQQLANAENTTDRLDLELQERKLDLERVEELERKIP